MGHRQATPAYRDPRGLPGVLQDIKENYAPNKWRGLALGFSRFAMRYLRYGKTPDRKARARFYFRLAEALLRECTTDVATTREAEQIAFAFDEIDRALAAAPDEREDAA